VRLWQRHLTTIRTTTRRTTNTMSNGYIIDTPEGIAHFRFCAVIRALRLEINTGMAMSRFPILSVCRQYGVTARTKVKALAEMEALYEETYGHPYGS